MDSMILLGVYVWYTSLKSLKSCERFRMMLSGSSSGSLEVDGKAETADHCRAGSWPLRSV